MTKPESDAEEEALALDEVLEALSAFDLSQVDAQKKQDEEYDARIRRFQSEFRDPMEMLAEGPSPEPRVREAAKLIRAVARLSPTQQDAFLQGVNVDDRQRVILQMLDREKLL